MYILFADDNDNGNTDPSYTIDNFAVSTPGVSPTITVHPTNQTVQQCRSVTFRSQASGSPPLTFQWYKDGVAMDLGVNPSAGTPTLTISNVQSGDAGSYFMRASNPFPPAADSNPATLTYQADNTPPSITSATFDAFDFTMLTVTFSEPVDGLLALDNFNWTIENAVDPGDVLGILTIAFTTAVSNQIAFVFDPPRDPTKNYIITAQTIDDVCAGNQGVPPGTSAAITNPGLGFQEGLNGYAGTHDTEIQSAFADTPGGSTGSPDAGAVNVDNADQGGIARALLRFDNIFGNGAAQIPFGAVISNATLTVGTSDLGTVPVLVFRMLVDWSETTTTWNTLGGGIDDGTNGTEAVFFTTLDSGQDEQTDSLNVTAQVQEWANGGANYGWAFVATGTDGWRMYTSEGGTMRPRLLVQYGVNSNPCEILTHPQSVTVNECGNFTLTVAASGAGLTYQWKRNGADIPGATQASYTVNGAKPSQHAGTYTVVVSGTIPPSPCTSNPATVTITPETTRPTVVSAVGNPGQTTITITFAHQCPLNPTDAQNPLNYTVSGGVTVNSALLAGSVVTLATTPRTAGNNYSLTIRNIKDTSDAQNVLSPNPTVIGTLLQRVAVLAKDATWKFRNDGPNFDAVNWTAPAPAYDDSAWPSAQALLGLETSGGIPAALLSQGWNTNNLTLLSRTNSVGGGLNGTNVTDFFRTTVNLPFSLSGAVIEIRHAIDDGAVFYFNGTEVGRFNMPPASAGPVGYLTNALVASGEGITRTLSGLTGLVTGNNTIAVEVHQNVFSSSDVVFGVELTAIYGATPPTLTIVNNGNGTVTISWSPAGGTLQQSTDLVTWTNTASQANPQTMTATGALFFRIAP
jgi:hypothetical protein